MQKLKGESEVIRKEEIYANLRKQFFNDFGKRKIKPKLQRSGAVETNDETLFDISLQDENTKKKLDDQLRHMVMTESREATKITDFLDFEVFFVVCLIVCVVFTVCMLGLSVLALLNRYYESRNGELTFYKKLSKNLKKMSNRNLIMKMLKIQFDTKTKRK